MSSDKKLKKKESHSEETLLDKHKDDYNNSSLIPNDATRRNYQWFCR